MNLSTMRLRSIGLLAVLAVLVGLALPVFAQHRGGGHSGRAGASRGTSRAASPRVAPRAAPRPGVAVPRGTAVPRGFASVAPVRFYRPYYAFRPRVSLGFGLWAGYPIAYSYAYYDPFYYTYGYPYAYAAYGYPYAVTGFPAYPSASTYPPSTDPSAAPGPQGSIGVQPDQASTGGLSFDITPNTAQVFVDGNYVGTVGQFTSTSQPLGVAAGRHRVEVRAPGYQTMSFDVDIIAGQVIPYQGTMER